VTRVLVIDDEPQIVRALRINLRVRSYQVDTATTGSQALEVAARHPPDLVILDLGLPDLDGVQVIEGLRGWTQAPIIVLSGRADSTDKVEALDAGADDYVIKPFGMEELLARMRAAARRAAPEADEPHIRLGELVVDLAAKRVTRDGAADAGQADVRLTPTEMAPARGPAAQPGQAAQPAPAADRGLGPGIRGRRREPPAVHGAAAPQAGARSGAAPLAAHRARHGLPLPARPGHRAGNRLTRHYPGRARKG
jgi:two-component system, OmpR family, KDP operon response regulator KdpE